MCVVVSMLSVDVKTFALLELGSRRMFRPSMDDFCAGRHRVQLLA